MDMMEKQGCFWLYKGDERVTGLYGAYSQFTNSPKVYTRVSKRQQQIVLDNLAHKIKRLLGVATPTSDTFLDALAKTADSVSSDLIFDNVRVFTVDDELVATYKIVVEDGEVRFVEVLTNEQIVRKYESIMNFLGLRLIAFDFDKDVFGDEFIVMRVHLGDLLNANFGINHVVEVLSSDGMMRVAYATPDMFCMKRL